MKQTDIRFWSYLAQFCLEWEMFQTKLVEKIKTHILCSVNFVLKNRTFFFKWDNLEKKYGRAGKAKDDNVAHAHGMWHT